MMEKNVCNKNGYHVDLCSTRRLKIWEKNIFIQWIKKNQSFFLPIYKFICAHNKVYSFYCFVFVVRISDVQSGPIVIWDFLKETASAKYCFFFFFKSIWCSSLFNACLSIESFVCLFHKQHDSIAEELLPFFLYARRYAIRQLLRFIHAYFFADL